MPNRQVIAQRMSTSGKKRFLGTLGDASAFNWVLAVLRIAAAVRVIYWGQSFLSAFGEGVRGPRDFSTGYYMAQYSLALAVVTLVATALYTFWTWIDSRHPLRRAHQANIDYATAQFTGPPNQRAWIRGLQTFNKGHIKEPGMGTMRYYDVHRLTISRLFAERRHISKLLYACLLFTLLVSHRSEAVAELPNLLL